MALEAGTVLVTLQFAQGLRDRDFFGKQDPYVIVKCGTQTYRTRTAIDGGKAPVFNQTFEFNIINENSVDLTLMDEDTLSRDDLIGKASISLARAREHGSDVVQAPVVCTRKNKQYGFIQVSLTFRRNQDLRRPYGQPAYQPQPLLYQAPTAPYYGQPYAQHYAQPAAYAPPAYVPYAAAPTAYAPPPAAAPQYAPWAQPAPVAYAPPAGYPQPAAPAAAPAAAQPQPGGYYPSVPSAPGMQYPPQQFYALGRV